MFILDYNKLTLTDRYFQQEFSVGVTRWKINRVGRIYNQ